MREIFLHFGMIDAAWPVVSAALARGNNIVVLPGGAAEAAYAAPGRADLVLSCHRGFIELALEHGAALVPVYTFGDNDLGLRACHHPLLGLADLFKAVTGIWLPRVLPARRTCAVTTVVGEMIPTPRRGPGGASEAEVTEYHTKYTQALKALYAAHVAECGGPSAAAEIRIVA